MKPKKIPMRMCVGCREMKEKKALLRIVRNAQGEISFDRIGKAPGSVMLDRTGKASGRGAYVCPSSQCLEKARKAKTLERALEASIEPAVYDQLAKELDARGE